ncbi:MAG TPA: hypothetical protein VJG32_00630 [Anaerolineae bacterium]|nr:hypothetical protein [Anaerolineae bacterium]
MKTRKIHFLLIALALVSLAWQSYPGTPEVPYTGTFSKEYIPNGVWMKAESIKWNSGGVSAMKSNVWSELFDQTADCTTSSPTGDKLYPILVATNLPNTGARTFDDCVGPAPDVQEEIELYLNTNSIVAGTSYYYNVKWQCNTSSDNGEVNITFEMDLFGGKYWLDKKLYSIYSMGGCTGPAAPAPNAALDSSGLESAVEDQFSSDTSRPPLEEQDKPLWSVQDPNDTYSYRVVRTRHGKTRVRMQVDFHTPGVFEQYKALNLSLVDTLREREQPTLVV